MLLNPFTSGIRYRDGIPMLPGAFPLVGHMPAMLRHEYDLIMNGWQAHGPLFWLNFGIARGWQIVCCGGEAMELLRQRPEGFSSFPHVDNEVIGRFSIIKLQGQEHRQIRGAMNAPFTPRGLAVANAGKLIAELAQEQVDRWVERGRINVLAETQDLALRIVFRLVGISQADIQEWTRQYREFTLGFIPIPYNLPGFPLRRMRRARAWIAERLLELAAQARRSGDTTSLIGALVNQTNKAAEGLTDEQLVENVRGLLLAGYETNATAMAWMVIHLAQRPELWRALCAEAGGQGRLPLTPQELKAYPMAEALMRESVRFHPPATTAPRKLNEPVTLYGHTIPAGRPLAVSLLALSHDPSVFPEAQHFNPHRWIDRDGAPAAHEIAAFGGGAHFCLGHHLAIMEGTVFAVALALAMSRAGLQPHLAGRAKPHPVYLPLSHPNSSAQIAFIRDPLPAMTGSALEQPSTAAEKVA